MPSNRGPGQPPIKDERFRKVKVNIYLPRWLADEINGEGRSKHRLAEKLFLKHYKTMAPKS